MGVNRSRLRAVALAFEQRRAGEPVGGAQKPADERFANRY